MGDTTLAEILPTLEKFFAAWKPGDVLNLTVYLIDRPGAPQRVIMAGHVAPPHNPEEIALDIWRPDGFRRRQLDSGYRAPRAAR
ncbi:MAG TPA: hypothetical protein VN442_18130 [Bryobacteraceae bacterium]|nr:hypothetical protein [Bryobacteraceae bacterium]